MLRRLIEPSHGKNNENLLLFELPLLIISLLCLVLFRTYGAPLAILCDLLIVAWLKDWYSSLWAAVRDEPNPHAGRPTPYEQCKEQYLAHTDGVVALPRLVVFCIRVGWIVFLVIALFRLLFG